MLEGGSSAPWVAVGEVASMDSVNAYTEKAGQLEADLAHVQAELMNDSTDPLHPLDLYKLQASPCKRMPSGLANHVHMHLIVFSQVTQLLHSATAFETFHTSPVNPVHL